MNVQQYYSFSVKASVEFQPDPTTDWIFWNPLDGRTNIATNPGEYQISGTYSIYNGGQFHQIEAGRDFDIFLRGGTNYGTIGFTTATSYGFYNSITLGGSTRQVHSNNTLVVDTPAFPFTVGGDFFLKIERRLGIVRYYATNTSNIYELAYENTGLIQNGAFNIYAYSYGVNILTDITAIKY